MNKKILSIHVQQLQDKNWLYNKYIEEKLSSSKIAKIVGCSERTVCRKLNQSDITIRGSRERYVIMYNNNQIPNIGLTKEILIQEYLNNKKSSLEISKQYNCSDSCIRKQLRKYNIPIRSLKESNSKGSNHWNWKGGITSVYEQIRKCDEYKKWRLSVFKRDNFTCQQYYDNKGGNLQVDHIRPFIKILKENKISSLDEALRCILFWDINNGRTLCIECHKKTTTYGHSVHNYQKEN